MSSFSARSEIDKQVEKVTPSDPLNALVEASATLLRSTDLAAVLSRVLELARRIVVADACAVWRNVGDNRWRVVASAELPRELEDEAVTDDPNGSFLSLSPYVIPDIQAEPRLAGRRELHRKHGINSLLVLPLEIQGQASGTITFYFRQRREFSAEEMKYSAALANLASSVISTAELYQRQTEERQRFRYLAEVSSALASSLDYETTLQRVADLTVPHIADGCNVYLIEGSRLRSVAHAVADPAKRVLAAELSHDYVEELRDEVGAGKLIKIGQPVLFRDVPEELLAEFALDANHLELLRQIGIRSAISVPLFARGSALGVLRLITAESGRRFTREDLEMARDLGNRAAMAIDNARLHRALERDIASRKEAERELRSSEERYRFVTEALPIHVWFGERGTIEYCNQHLLQFTGLTMDELRAGQALKLIHPNDLERVVEASRESFKTGKPFKEEYRARNAEGQYRWVMAESRQFMDAQGRLKWLGTSIDITERKQAEEALLRSEKLAAAGRLAATIAHEINNPLEAVTNLVYLAEMNPTAPDEVRTSLAEADRQLHHVAHIVRQTLGFYRETSAPQSIRMRELIDSVVDLYLRKLAAKKVTLRVKVPDDMRLTVVAGEIRQVIANLIANAIDAVPTGGEIVVHAQREGNAIELSVIDNGAGISADFASQLFQPFFTTKKEVGTGLGLWVSRQIIEKHGGSLTYGRDNVAETTTFRIFLPVEPATSKD